MFQPFKEKNHVNKENPGTTSRGFLVVMLAMVLASGSAISAQNAANEPRLIDRLYFDAGATVHVPQNYPSLIGGLAGFGMALRDFNVTLTMKYGSSVSGLSLTNTIIGVRIEPKIVLIPNTLILLPSAYAGFSSAKASPTDSNSVKIEGLWIEAGFGAELMATQDISLLPRFYYAFNKLGTTPPNYADMSAIGMDLAIRYYLGQNRRLSY